MKFLKIFLWFLDQAGLVDQLTQFLVNLYEEQEKPTDAISYMRKALAQGKKTTSHVSWWHFRQYLEI